jgi:hypothetical protein
MVSSPGLLDIPASDPSQGIQGPVKGSFRYHVASVASKAFWAAVRSFVLR